MSTTLLKRAAAGLAAVAIAIPTLAATASAEPAPAPSPASSAADFLAAQLQASDHVLQTSGFNDFGLTADVVLALAAAGEHEADALAATDAIAAQIGGYIGTDFGGELYAGAVAKSLVLAVVMGADPADFGGVDLVTALQGLQQDNGRFSDDSAFGDFSNSIGQAFAILGLEGAGVGTNQVAVTYLLDAQCADGAFPLDPSADGCLSDPDVTAFVLQALLVSPHATEDAISAATAYLVGQQSTSGGLTGGTSTSGVNVNSTGLAGALFAAMGLDEEAAAATAYVAGLQYGDAFPAEVRGGIAYDSAVFAARAAGQLDLGQDTRTTAQGMLALTCLTYADLTGALEGAPARTCVVPAGTPTETATAEPTAGPSETATPTGSATASPSASGPVIETDVLAQSDSPVVPLVVLALLLLLAGGGAVAAGVRVRSGEHR